MDLDYGLNYNFNRLTLFYTDFPVEIKKKFIEMILPYFKATHLKEVIPCDSENIEIVCQKFKELNKKPKIN